MNYVQITQYTFKYHMKPNKKDETKNYTALNERMKEALANNMQKHKQDCNKVLHLICLGAFAHNSKKVVGGPIAAWLIQHDKRFFSSHEDIYVPLSDLHRCLTNEKIDSQVQYTSNNDNYLEN